MLGLSSGVIAGQFGELNAVCLIGHWSSRGVGGSTELPETRDCSYHNGQHRPSSVYNSLTHNGQHRPSIVCNGLTLMGSTGKVMSVMA